MVKKSGQSPMYKLKNHGNNANLFKKYLNIMLPRYLNITSADERYISVHYNFDQALVCQLCCVHVHEGLRTILLALLNGRFCAVEGDVAGTKHHDVRL